MTPVECQSLVDVLYGLREARRQRDIYREMALSAIHLLHGAHVRFTRQQQQIRSLHDELRVRRRATRQR